MKTVSRVLIAAALAAPLALSSVAIKAQDLADAAAATGQFETMIAAVKGAGMGNILKGEGPYTIFAPTDAAFAELPAGTMENLMRPENKDKLARFVSYYMVPGKVTSDDMRNKQMTAKTLGRDKLDINSLNGGVRVDKAMVVGKDIEASNGVIHAVDTVVIPE